MVRTSLLHQVHEILSELTSGEDLTAQTGMEAELEVRSYGICLNYDSCGVFSYPPYNHHYREPQRFADQHMSGLRVVRPSDMYSE
jgi:hypothetical protein